ncbi:6-pyruvoyl-tetrahydropterin synthase-related protein [Granulicella sp. S190]|uniref:6-pyruvoyl-tetrahydropterin synthase-related protein n=1 Tax=Granulicella sp. S190 TaxID=1747226 RepID=UPI00131DD909|nr:6-pyruvoyl-tetrahydropterin synthase-related protein [Granulicella sp. S190]
MQRDRLSYLLIPLIALVAVLPLIFQGCSCGHDFDFHILSWLEAARQFTHGNLHPHWAYTPAYNAGEPRFVFYPPLSWTLGAILTLLFPITATPILYTWLALTASGLALHRLARDFAPPTAALIAAVLYTVNPYMLFTAYERTAYAELLAAAIIPLLLHAILSQQVTIPRIALPVALLWLTNAPAAVMSCYALALLTLIRTATNSPDRSISTASNTRTDTNLGAPYLDSEMWASRESATAPANSQPTKAPPQSRLQVIINTIAGTALGLALAAFYILPAAYERRYVQIAMAIIPNMRIQDNFLFHHTGDAPHDQVLHTASLLAITLIATTILAIVTGYLHPPAQHSTISETQIKLSDTRESQHELTKEASSRPKRSVVERPPHFAEAAVASNHSHSNSPFASLATLAIAITLLLTPITAFIWKYAPELAFLQFPWRLLAVLAAVSALTIALALTTVIFKPATRTVIAITIAAALTYPAYTAFHQTCDDPDTPTAREALFHSNQGTEPTDEYTPTTADNDSLLQTDPAFWLATDPNAKAPANTQPGPAPEHLTINAPIAEDLILNLRDYPSWHITLNGSPITTRDQRDQRDDGLIVLPVPAGPSTIAITYAHTLDQTLGDAISLLALAALLFLLRRKPQPATA